MEADLQKAQPVEPNPFELLASADSEDRAFGAFLLGSAKYTSEVREVLMHSLKDDSPDVVGMAAQSLALQDDIDSLRE